MRFPVLVSLSRHDPQEKLSLHIELFIRYYPRESKLTLCLLVSHCSHKDQNTQPFALQYDPDKIVPGSVSFDEVDILPNESSRIERAGNPETRKLSFSLKGPCITWEPPLSGDHKPCCSCESPSDELIQLSQAREFSVWFDYNWVHQNARSWLTWVIRNPEKLFGHSLAEYYKKRQYKPTNLSACNPGDNDIHADAGDTTEDEEPPAYNELENDLDGSTTSSPLPLEVMGSPTQENNASLPEYLPAAATSPESINECDVEKQSQPLCSTMVYEQSLTPSPPQFMASQILSTSPPPKLSTLVIQSRGELKRTIKYHVEKMYTQVEMNADDRVDAAYKNLLYDYKHISSTLANEKDDAVSAIRGVACDIVETFRESLEEIKEEVENKEGVHDMMPGLNELQREKELSLEQNSEESGSAEREWSRGVDQLSRGLEQLSRGMEQLSRGVRQLSEERKKLRKERRRLKKERRRLKKERRRLEARLEKSGS